MGSRCDCRSEALRSFRHTAGASEWWLWSCFTDGKPAQESVLASAGSELGQS